MGRRDSIRTLAAGIGSVGAARIWDGESLSAAQSPPGRPTFARIRSKLKPNVPDGVADDEMYRP